MLQQVISIGAAILILIAYGMNHLGKWNRENISYIVLNLIGSTMLTYFAVLAGQMGLIVMEGAWAIISMAALAKILFRGNSVPGGDL